MTTTQPMPPLKLREGQFYIGGCKVQDIAATFGTPTYVTDEQRIRENCRRLIVAFQKNYPKFRLNYAVKANNNISILNIIRQEGAGADCSCIEELQLAKLAGFASDRMLYSGNYNTVNELEQGVSSGAAVNLDDVELLPRLLKYGLPEILSFRVNPGIGEGQYPGLVFAGENAKFGVEESRVEEAYRMAKSGGIKKFGIHMMTGSNVLNPDYFSSVTRKLFEIAEKIATKVGLTFEFVDIGGGFGVPYKEEEHSLDIDKIGAGVGSVFTEFVERGKIGQPNLMIEPGRFVACDSTILLGRVHHIKTTSKKKFVGTDIGMNTLLRPALYGAYHHVYIANSNTTEEVVTITGQVCENTDILAKDRKLPQMKIGDVIIVMNAGAYGFSMSSQYNSRPRAAEVLVHQDNAEIIRDRETVIDLITRQRIPVRLQK